jgi:hypothetical protein
MEALPGLCLCSLDVLFSDSITESPLREKEAESVAIYGIYQQSKGLLGEGRAIHLSLQVN